MTAFATPFSDFVAQTAITSDQMDANFAAIATFFNTTGVNVYQAGTVDGTAMAAGPFAAYRTIFQQNGTIAAGSVAATYYHPVGAVALASAASTAANTVQVPMFNIQSADYAIAGKTTKLSLRVNMYFNATAPGTITFTTGLYPVTIAGGAAVFTPSLGTVVSGSTVAVVNPSASTFSTGSSGSFALPSNGAYTIGTVLSATAAANSLTGITATLMVNHV